MEISNRKLSDYLYDFIKKIETDRQKPLSEDEMIKLMDFLIGYLDLEKDTYLKEAKKYINT